jgi:antitoxin component YwqK of YwqJK toxin-antitoxin module
MSTSTPARDFTGLWVQRSEIDGSRCETEYVAGRPNGRFRVYLHNGVVQREGFKVDGLYHGELITRNNRGEVLDVSRFEHGTGVYRIFMTSGQLAWEISIRAGKRHGPTKRFNWRGELVRVEEYRDGELSATIEYGGDSEVVPGDPEIRRQL